MKLLSKSLLALITWVMVLSLSTITTSYANEAGIKELRGALAKRMPTAANASIKITPVAGLYEVMAGKQILYMSQDARYIFDGDLYDMNFRQNLTENARGAIRLQALDNLGEENMLVYMPTGEVKHTITVFTDIYCPYCQKLHDEMADYQKNGIKVRYIFVPFKGPKSVQTSISVWCAKDRNKAMDLAKKGGKVEEKTCDNPISKHQALAAELGIRGTPAIMLESGVMMPGYVPSTKVIEQLNAK